jgi:hypothetical protein
MKTKFEIITNEDGTKTLSAYVKNFSDAYCPIATNEKLPSDVEWVILQSSDGRTFCRIRLETLSFLYHSSWRPPTGETSCEADKA